MTKRPSLSNIHAVCKDGLPVEFKWQHDAQQVFLTGTFDGWAQSIPMAWDAASDVWRATVLLDPRTRYAFKFVVDGVWRCSLDYGTCSDASGNTNNILEARQ